jgi:hypothetical protein
MVPVACHAPLKMLIVQLVEVDQESTSSPLIVVKELLRWSDEEYDPRALNTVKGFLSHRDGRVDPAPVSEIVPIDGPASIVK